MGQSQSSATPTRQVSSEQLSHELALRFATKCFTHLEIAHYKDNFKTLADHQDEIEYWKEETLCRFLCLPDALEAGSIIYQMATYLGAFPFPSLAPCILTREAMLKVVTIMTERYGKILKRGKQDRVKLLFRSLAVFDRKTSVGSPTEGKKPSMAQLVAEQKPDSMIEEEATMKEVRSHVAGFAIDDAANDDEEEEDDDELALAALDSLDAIEVFKLDQKTDRKIHHAQVPVENFRKLLKLLLVISPLGPQENLAEYGQELSDDHLQALDQEVDSIIAAFEPENTNGGIGYSNFTRAISSSLPNLFDPFNALFEHFLFSKNLDLSTHRKSSTPIPPPLAPKTSPIVSASSDNDSALLTPAVLSHISTFLPVTTSASASSPNLFHANARFHPLYSTATHGTSMTQFSRQVSSWQAATLMLLSGTPSDESSSSSESVTLGAYLPSPWSSSASSSSTYDSAGPKPMMFQLAPRHAIFLGNPYNRAAPTSHYSLKTGIALGCVIPPSSRSHAASHPPILGPVSLRIDSDICDATFQHDANEGTGSFLPDPGLEAAQRRTGSPKKVEFEIDSLEIWGVTISQDGEEDEATKQKKRLSWDEAEAARRSGVNFGSDKDGARALLEMAGIVGDKAGVGRSGGSV